MGGVAPVLQDEVEHDGRPLTNSLRYWRGPTPRGDLSPAGWDVLIERLFAMADLWYPKAVRMPGPEWKQGYGTVRSRLGRGAVVHSMEGRLQAALARLESSDRASWTGSLPVVGGVIQHYPLRAVTWHAGGYANRLWAGWEVEGRVGEPLSPQQIETLVDLLDWQAQEERWPGFILEPNTGTLHEHNWYMATSCPSGRIPWDRLIAELTEEESVAEKSLTREQCINIYKAQAGRQATSLKQFWQYVFAMNGWAWPA